MSHPMFEDYDNISVFENMRSKLASLGFKDSSWHNDACPCVALEMSNGDWIQVFVDYSDANLRDATAAPMFSVVWNDGTMGRYFDCLDSAADLAKGLAMTLDT